MKRVAAGLSLVGLSALLALSLSESAPASSPLPPPLPEDLICTSCGDGKKSYVEPLSELALDKLLEEFALEPLCEGSPALEKLLFHHAQVDRRLRERPPYLVLDNEHLSFLSREVGRNKVEIELRVVDEEGQERLSTGAQTVSLGKKAHLHTERTLSIQAGEFNGTVVRVGLNHLWTRY